MAGEAYAKPIYVRADGRAAYATVAQVMASLSESGFSSIDLITDTGGPSSGADAVRSPPQAGAPASRP
jgi:biopolymer transport protein TolR